MREAKGNLVVTRREVLESVGHSLGGYPETLEWLVK
jgi:hypothetical protein